QAERGVVAVENSLHGSINAVYRLLARSEIWVSGEAFLHIEQYLIGAPKSPGSLDTLEKVISQPPAIAQCELWLENNVPNARIEEFHDTAESVRYVTEHSDEACAAIAGKHAAELYGGNILAGPINDDEHNYTRFFLIGNDKGHTAAADKTSIILRTNHQPGALFNAIGAFAQAGINLSKLDSHPIAGDNQHYAFYIDFEAGLNDKLEHDIFDVLRDQGCTVTVLGSYVAKNGV
ncbi:MAG: prephenate dehydratase, partial [Acidobacteriota bacterium]